MEARQHADFCLSPTRGDLHLSFRDVLVSIKRTQSQSKAPQTQSFLWRHVCYPAAANSKVWWGCVTGVCLCCLSRSEARGEQVPLGGWCAFHDLLSLGMYCVLCDRATSSAYKISGVSRWQGRLHLRAWYLFFGVSHHRLL